MNFFILVGTPLFRAVLMIIECRKGKKAFSRLIFQPLQKAKKCFLLLYHCNRNRQISFRNLLANQRFAVEILEFRLSIVVIMIIVCRKGNKPFRGCENSRTKILPRFLELNHFNRNRQISYWNLLANLWFAVEILWISTSDCRY